MASLSMKPTLLASTQAAAPRAARASAMKPRLSKASAPSSRAVSRVATKAVPMEVAQMAGEAGFIAGTAFTMMSMVMIGLAVGFVLLRVEGLIEGK